MNSTVFVMARGSQLCVVRKVTTRGVMPAGDCTQVAGTGQPLCCWSLTTPFR